jgi:hypothetical protein
MTNGYSIQVARLPASSLAFHFCGTSTYTNRQASRVEALKKQPLSRSASLRILVRHWLVFREGTGKFSQLCCNLISVVGGDIEIKWYVRVDLHQGDGKRPNIHDWPGVSVCIGDFRGLVLVCSGYGVVVPSDPRDPKVAECKVVPLAGQSVEDVLGLDVAVTDAPVRQELERQQDLVKYLFVEWEAVIIVVAVLEASPFVEEAKVPVVQVQVDLYR